MDLVRDIDDCEEQNDRHVAADMRHVDTEYLVARIVAHFARRSRRHIVT